ncbi:MAG TPA: hypothetical protein PLT63_03640 [Syntrophales bacterium]|nr:hypothetical protein [Syntrophales bacterium]
MGKQPAFQFYPGDWTRDLDDQDLETEGAWIRIICRLWWSETRGEATKSIGEWSRILRKSEKKTMKIFQNLIAKRIADGCLLDNQNITIISRRMKRMVEISQIRYQVGLKGGNPALMKTRNNLVNQTSNQNARSSSSTSSSIKKESIKKEKIQFINNKFQTIPDALITKWREVAPGIIINDEIKKAELWLLAHPEKRRSRYDVFLSNWMVRAQERFIKYGGGNGRTKPDFTGDKRESVQTKIDADLAKANALYAAAKAAAAFRAGGDAGNDDAPDFQNG